MPTQHHDLIRVERSYLLRDDVLGRRSADLEFLPGDGISHVLQSVLDVVGRDDVLHAEGVAIVRGAKNAIQGEDQITGEFAHDKGDHGFAHGVHDVGLGLGVDLGGGEFCVPSGLVR